METTCYHHKCDAQLTLLSRETRQEVDSHILQNGLHQTTGTISMCQVSWVSRTFDDSGKHCLLVDKWRAIE